MIYSTHLKNIQVWHEKSEITQKKLLCIIKTQNLKSVFLQTILKISDFWINF